MTFQGLEFTNTRPFKECIIHGLIRDKNGIKMSKSLGNGVDPMDVIEKYGADSLRYFLTTSTSPGMDLRFDEEKVASTWNFINKLWNASRYVLMNLEDYHETNENLTISDKWILNKLNETIKTVRKHMDKYEFNVVGDVLYSFIWNDFCDWYIELAKINMNDTTKTVLVKVLTSILKMLHPFMPYVTEEIYLKLPNHDKSIMISSYPKEDENIYETELDDIIELIKKIRKIKLENNLKNYIISFDNKILLENKNILSKMLKNDQINIEIDENLSKIETTFLNDIVTIYYDGSLSTEEINNLKKEKERLINSIERRKKLLSNENYINKAPSNIVNKEKDDLSKEEQDLKLIIEKIVKCTL